MKIGTVDLSSPFVVAPVAWRLVKARVFDPAGMIGWAGSHRRQFGFWITFFEAGSKEFAVISESFDTRTLSKMEIALD